MTVPDYVSGKFRDMELTEMKEIGRDKIECKRFGPKLVHSVPYMNKRRRIDAGSSSAEIVDGRTRERAVTGLDSSIGNS